MGDATLVGSATWSSATAQLVTDEVGPGAARASTEEGWVGVALRSSSVRDMWSMAAALSRSSMRLPRLEKLREEMKSSSRRLSVGMAMPRGEKSARLSRPVSGGGDMVGGDRGELRAGDKDKGG